MRGSGAFRPGAAPGGALAPRWTQRRLWRAARATPSLDLNFADSKSLVDTVTGQSLVTFTRASSGIFVGSDGVLRTAANDVPRFDHNPLTGESLGLLVEEARTNLLLRSEEFGTTWGLGGLLAFGSGSTLDAVAGPSGTQTADLITEDSTSGSHFITQSGISYTSGTTYALSCWVKQGTGTRNVRLAFRSAAFGAAVSGLWNISTGSLVNTVGSPVATSITSFPNGWYRLSIAATATATALSNVDIQLVSSTNQNYQGDGASGVYLWGAQLEAGAFPTSYIPTTSATATRSADVASISSFSGPVGCLFGQFSNPASGSRGIASVNDNSANNRIELRTSGTDPFLTVINGGTTQGDIDAGAISANTVTRLAGRVTTDNFGASIAGGTEVLDTSGSVPTVTQLQIGRDQAGNYLNGRLARLAIWTQPLNTLQVLTQ